MISASLALVSGLLLVSHIVTDTNVTHPGTRGKSKSFGLVWGHRLMAEWCLLQRCSRCSLSCSSPTSSAPASAPPPPTARATPTLSARPREAARMVTARLALESAVSWTFYLNSGAELWSCHWWLCLDLCCIRRYSDDLHLQLRDLHQHHLREEPQLPQLLHSD